MGRGAQGSQQGWALRMAEMDEGLERVREFHLFLTLMNESSSSGHGSTILTHASTMHHGAVIGGAEEPNGRQGGVGGQGGRLILVLHL